MFFYTVGGYKAAHSYFKNTNNQCLKIHADPFCKSIHICLVQLAALDNLVRVI